MLEILFSFPSPCSFAILDTRVTTTEFRISVSARPTILSRKFTRRVVDLAWKHVSFPPGERLRDSKLSGGVERVEKGVRGDVSTSDQHCLILATVDEQRLRLGD